MDAAQLAGKRLTGGGRGHAGISSRLVVELAGEDLCLRGQCRPCPILDKNLWTRSLAICVTAGMPQICLQQDIGGHSRRKQRAGLDQGKRRPRNSGGLQHTARGKRIIKRGPRLHGSDGRNTNPSASFPPSRRCSSLVTLGRRNQSKWLVPPPQPAQEESTLHLSGTASMGM